MKNKIVLLLSLLCAMPAFAQEDKDFRQKFTDGNYHIEYQNYGLAVPLFKELAAAEPDNSNLNYKVGFTIIKSNRNKRNAIPYLEKAILNISENYDDLNPYEKKAPVVAYYYLANAYHVANRLDEAIATYNKFMEEAGKKHFMQPEAARQIVMVNNAREFMATPTKVNITNLKDSINSQYPDYSPVITIDESALYFTSRRETSTGGSVALDGQYYEDIYVSVKEGDVWGAAKPIGPSINTADHEATIGLSADGQTLFIYKGDEGGSLHMSELVGKEWSVPVKLGSDINTPSWETHAALSADGRTLYFVSDRDGGMGGRDIWFAKKLPNGQWARAQNAGNTINTPYDEESPFIHPDGKQLFFSSTGHKSMGGFDIFFSDLQENGTWGVPQNIGYPINTTDDDIFYVPSADGKRAYLSSLRDDGMGEKDIYMITSVDAMDRPLTVLVGYVKPIPGEQLPQNMLITVTGTDINEPLTFKPNIATGKYVITLPPGNYTITYEAEGEQFFAEDVFVPAESAYKQINKEIDMETLSLAADEVPADTVAKVDKASYTEFFTYNINAVNVNSKGFKAFMDSLQMIINSKGVANLGIESSASSVPTRKYKSNEALARLRAEQAKDKIMAALKAKGFTEDKVKFVSTSTLVQGPEYAGDAANRKKYEPYQYVKVTAQ